MITDQNQTGVPSATRTRIQLFKPKQVMNSGSTEQTNKLDAEAAAKAITSANYNPIKANTPNPLQAPSVSPTPQVTTPVTPETDETGYNAKYGYNTGITDPKTGESLFANQTRFGQPVQATPSYQDMVEELGKQFSNLTDNDKLRFLDNVANGIYKANGMQTSATMTGEPNTSNTVGTRIQNLGQAK